MKKRMLSKDQIKLMNELRVRHHCVRGDIAIRGEGRHLNNNEYGDLIRKQINQEREFFSKKHNIPVDDILKMEDAYNELGGVEEQHQFLDYRKICDFSFYKILKNIVGRQVSVDGLGKSFVPTMMQFNLHDRWQKKVEKRVRRCRRALERIVPQMSLFEYEDIRYAAQYQVDHNNLEEKDFEEDVIVRLCEHALCKDYFFNSKWKRFLHRWLCG